MSSAEVFVLGGYQTDFSRNWSREGLEIIDLIRSAAEGVLEETQLDAAAIQTAHVGNFTGELFCRQGHLGGLVAASHPAWAGLPCGRHEAACASGSIAMLAASAEIEAGRYDTALVLGVELMKNVPALQAAEYLGAPAMWSGHECLDVRFPWPHQFARLGDEYERRYGLKREHLAALAKQGFDNAKKNPNAQTRSWKIDEQSFSTDEEKNPTIEGRIRKHDCGQITDGAAAVVLASAERAQSFAKNRGIPLERVPRLKGFGHRTAPIDLDTKLRASADAPLVFPHVRAAVDDALRRAQMADVFALDAVEVHDCFSTTAYMAIDHLGITAPGESHRAIEEGTVALGGKLPLNASGGLIGGGHPVGATGVRMVVDAWRQVTGRAGDYQVEGAKNVGTLNLGGSATTVVSFVVGTP